VPLILKLPRGDRAGESVSRPVGLVDVAPTVMSILGLPGPPMGEGRSLLEDEPIEGDARPLFAETLYPRLHFGWSDLSSVVRGDHQYIDAPRPELYDLSVDPGQRDDRIDVEAGRAAVMSDLLAGWNRNFAAPGAVDADERQQLEALGYVAAPAPTVTGPRPDPKDRIHVLEELRDAQALMERGSAAAAAAAFAEVLRREPGIEDAWVLLIRTLRSAGDDRAAQRAVTEARDALPESDALRLEAASLLVAEGRFDEAEPLAAAATDHDPVTARVLLAQVHMARGSVEVAEREARRALADGPDRPEPWLVLAEVLATSDRVADAVAVLSGVAGDASRPPPTRLQLAEQLFRQGYAAEGRVAIGDLAAVGDPDALRLLARDAVQRQEWEAARQRLTAYLELRPSDARATVDLGLVLMAIGETAAARQALESGLAMDDTLADGWNALGVQFAEEEDLAGAIRAWERALAAQPAMISIHYNLAMAKARSGRPGEAARHLETLAAAREGEERRQLLDMARRLRAEAGR
jgi:tetratricopeptide (TPR) repeat protein